MNVIRRTDKLFERASRFECEQGAREGISMPHDLVQSRGGKRDFRKRELMRGGWVTPAKEHTGLTKRGTLSTTPSYLPSSSRRFTTSGSLRRPGQRTSDSSSCCADSNVILAITSGRGEARSEVGIAAMDLRYPYMILCQISDCQTYVDTLTKINILNPIEVLMPDTMYVHAAGKNELRRSIEEKFPEIGVTPISRVHFNDSAGWERVKTLCAVEYSSVELILKEKYYALAATAALLKYVEFVKHSIYAPRSMRIEFEGSPNSTVIDIESARSLELVTSQFPGQREVSLLRILDRCSTPMGRKLLRARILQPPCDKRTILERQACVAELVSNCSLRALIQPAIRRLYGADRLLTMATRTLLCNNNNAHSAEQNLNYILLLKNSLDILPELRSTLQTGKAPFFKKVSRELENPQYILMRDKILELIHPDARSVMGYTSSNMQRCFAIKAGINDLLDIARQTYCELIDDMKGLVEGLTSKYKFRFSLSCNASLGFHMQVVLPRHSNVDLPAEFIQVRKSRGCFTMTTKALFVLSQQCKMASEEVHMMSNVLLHDLLNNIRQYIGCLFQLNVNVAELDVAVSLAQVSSIPERVRPTFGSALKLENSSHPIMEICGFDRPVPNDVFATVPHHFHVITGANMSGKSTYLKQIVLLQIMAQIGCYVPATRAEFRIANRIFCKLSSRDDMECNASTFVLEMKEVQYILRSVTASSLIILDELCRGTTSEEGCSIAWTICERLLTTSAFTFTSTHFTILTRLASFYHNVINEQFETIDSLERNKTGAGSSVGSSSRPVNTYRLRPGLISADDYGIALAELCGLPKSATENARKYASEYLLARMVNHSNTNLPSSSDKQSYDLVGDLYTLIDSDRFNRETIADVLARAPFMSVGIGRARLAATETISLCRMNTERNDLEITKNTIWNRALTDQPHRVKRNENNEIIASHASPVEGEPRKRAKLCRIEKARVQLERVVTPTNADIGSTVLPSFSSATATPLLQEEDIGSVANSFTEDVSTCQLFFSFTDELPPTVGSISDENET